MNMLYSKRIGLIAQYFLWSTMASARLEMTHTRLVFFMLGLMVLISLSGMQLREVLDSFERKKSKIFYVLTLSAVVGLTIYAF
jgi:hypothetical protein